MDKQRFILKLVLALGVIAIVIFALNIAKTEQVQDRFSVNGSGVVFAKPDIANLSIGFRTETKKTAAEAVEENSKKMNEIIKELKSLDIEAKDIKTTNYNLNPIYTWTEARGQELKGYEVYQTATVKIRDLDSIGDVVSKTAEKGANQIGSISFTIDDEYELKGEARELAIEKAKEKAEDIADKTGMKLGKIVNVYENQVYYPTATYANAKVSYDEAYGLGGGAIESPTIETGQNEVRVEVTIVYEVK